MNSKKSRESTPPVPPELKALIEKKPTSSLIEEAKKYKSADEFIQNKFVKKEKLKEGLSDYKISVKNGYVEFSIDRESGELIIDQIAAYEKNK